MFIICLEALSILSKLPFEGHPEAFLETRSRQRICERARIPHTHVLTMAHSGFHAASGSVTHSAVPEQAVHKLHASCRRKALVWTWDRLD